MRYNNAELYTNQYIKRTHQRPIARSQPDCQAYAETLLKDGSPPYGSYSLYKTLALMLLGE